jgi:hypothetical protein
MPRFTRPDRTNRDLSVNELWRRLYLEDTTISVVNETLFTLDHYLTEGQILSAIGTTHHLALATASIAIAARQKSSLDRSEALLRAFACFYWRTELLLTYRRVNNIDDQAREDGLIDLLNWQGLSLACGVSWFTDWTAPYILNLFRSGGVEKNSAVFDLDAPARNFVQTLQAILVTHQWPVLDERQKASLGPYAPLLTHAGDTVAFGTALTNFCDYRVAQCFGYADIDAVKRRRPSQIESLMDMASWGRVFPAELFTLQYAYQCATGKKLALNSEHPLLHTRLMTDPFPALEPLYDDEVTQKLVNLGASAFGAEWRLREPVALRYDA